MPAGEGGSVNGHCLASTMSSETAGRTGKKKKKKIVLALGRYTGGAGVTVLPVPVGVVALGLWGPALAWVAWSVHGSIK